MQQCQAVVGIAAPMNGVRPMRAIRGTARHFTLKILKATLITLCLSTVTALPANAAKPDARLASTISAMSTETVQAPWRQRVLSALPKKPGCFQSRYPAVEWKAISCTSSVRALKPFFHQPRSRPQDENLTGNQTALSSGIIQGAVGTISQSGVTQASGFGLSNSFTIQMNSNGFASPLCANHPSCIAAEQFVVDSGGSMNIQVWLDNYLTSTTQTCPDSTWSVSPVSTSPYVASCWKRAVETAASVDLPVHVFNQLNGILLSGFTTATGQDQFIMQLNGSLTAITLPSGLNFGLFGRWTDADFNVYGESDNEVIFNSGAKLQIQVSLVDNSSSLPTCGRQGVGGVQTVETSNLTLGPCAAFPTNGDVAHGIGFSESVGPPPTGAMQPSIGPSAGGSRITVTGTNFDPEPNGTVFEFNYANHQTPATNVSCPSTTQCTFIVPGVDEPNVTAVPVSVTVSGMTAPIGTFIYQIPPTPPVTPAECRALGLRYVVKNGKGECVGTVQ
jgi:hypothetical protein